MKKTTKSNPLKYFNDQADARKKAITEGGKKLVKAQIGIAALPPSLSDAGVKNIYQGPLDKTASAYLDKAYPSTSGTGKMPIIKGDSKFYSNAGKVAGTKIGPGTAEMYKRAGAENYIRGKNFSTEEEEGIVNNPYKKGGSTKSKKKK